jgi:hypothetical protein
MHPAKFISLAAPMQVKETAGNCFAKHPEELIHRRSSSENDLVTGPTVQPIRAFVRQISFPSTATTPLRDGILDA